MYSLPTSLSVDGQDYTIRERGDFRMVLDCFSALEDIELTKDERIISALIIFIEDFQTVEDVLQLPDIKGVYEGMVRFFNCGQDRDVGANVNHKVLDWEKDSNLICSAVNNVAGTEIRALDYLHWWTFMGYYTAVGQCALSTVVAIRHKIANNKKLQPYEKEFRKENPQYFNVDMRTSEQKTLDEYYRNLFYSGG